MKKRDLKDMVMYANVEIERLKAIVDEQSKRLIFITAESAKRERFLKDALSLISGVRQMHVLNPAAIKVALKELCDKYQYPI